MTDVTAAEHHDSELNDQVVAVGVDGSPEALAAARYAVLAADFRGLNLLMVHAYELPPLDVPMDQGILEACHQAARNLMADVAAQLVVPRQMRVDIVVQPDSPVVLLDDISRTVPLLVVGQDHLGWGERLTFGAVASHVGQKAQCPVVVALDEDTPTDAVLTAAFQEAEFLRTDLVVLHASPYRKGGPSGLEAEDANLVKWSRFAAVLVLGRRKRHGWSHWTHAVLRAVVKQTHSPLMVVPEMSERTEDRRASR